MKIKTVQLLAREISSAAYELENKISSMVKEPDVFKWDQLKLEATKLIFIVKGLAEQLTID